MSDVVIRAEHLSKMYRLGVINNGTLWKDLQTWLALKTGREDPHSKIGEDKYSGDEDHFWALKDLNFEIKQGDRVGIIGKNGAGKSTLLKILSRITTPTEGSVKIRGKVASLLEVGTGFHGELTGRENIYLNGAILGMKKRRIDRKLDEIIAFSGIEHHIDTPVKRYSSGMYVRLAFAVAAHLDSDILIADEVLAVGDAEFQKKALGKMQDLSTGQGRTVLFVSHNLSAVSNLCSSGIVMERGKVVFHGGVIPAIELYQGGADEGVAIFEIIPVQTDFQDTVKISGYRILDQDGVSPTGPLYQSKKYRIEFDLELMQPDAGLSLFLSYYGIDGTLLFASDVHDANEAAVDWLRSPGRKRGSCEIPTWLLLDGDYRVAFSCCIPMKGWPLPPSFETSLKFSFIRDASTNSRGYDEANHPLTGAKKPGYLSPVLQWSFVS